jgi:hypothetical protein
MRANPMALPRVASIARALAYAGAICLLFTTAAVAADRGTDPRGDVARPGLDILAVTTTFTDAGLTIDVELAGDWNIPDSAMGLAFATEPGQCDGYQGDFKVFLDINGEATLSSHVQDQAATRIVDGAHLTFEIPSARLGDSEVLYFKVDAYDAADGAYQISDSFPDQASEDLACQEVAVVLDPASASPIPAVTGSASGPSLTILPTALLVVASAGLLLYGGLVAMRRWRGASTP